MKSFRNMTIKISLFKKNAFYSSSSISILSFTIDIANSNPIYDWVFNELTLFFPFSSSLVFVYVLKHSKNLFLIKRKNK